MRLGSHACRSLLASILGIALTVGCGDEDATAVDASPTDGGAQSDAPDAATSAGTCGAQLPPIAGLLLVFNRPDGSLIGTQVTDVDGRASRDDCVAGTMISWVSFGDTSAIFTMAGVNPGDTVMIVNVDFEPQETVTTAQVTVDANVSGLDAPDAYSHTTCNNVIHIGPGASYSFEVGSLCLGTDGLFDSLSLARSGDNSGPIVGYAEARDIDPVAGATPVAVGPWVAVDPPAEIAVTVENAPPFAVSAGVSLRFLRDGVGFFTSGNSETPVDGGWTAGLVALPGDFFDWMHVSASVSYQSSSSHGFQRGQALASALTFDLSTVLLPRITGMLVSHTEDPRRPVISWLAEDSLDAADGIDFFFSWEAGTWFVVTPDAAAGSFQIPEMPDRLAPYLPRAESELRMKFAVLFDYGWATYTELVSRAWMPASLGFVVDWWEPPDDFFVGYSHWSNSSP